MAWKKYLLLKENSFYKKHEALSPLIKNYLKKCVTSYFLTFFSYKVIGKGHGKAMSCAHACMCEHVHACACVVCVHVRVRSCMFVRARACVCVCVWGGGRCSILLTFDKTKLYIRQICTNVFPFPYTWVFHDFSDRTQNLKKNYTLFWE